MGEVSTFKSRTGKLTCGADTFYTFITDIRNFRIFIPPGTANDLVIDKESCSFNVNMLGQVKIFISEKHPFEKVIFSGNALQINDFKLIADVLNSDSVSSEIRIILQAELNPFLKMVAAEPINRLLDTLIAEMEKFRRWDDIKKHNQPL